LDEVVMVVLVVLLVGIKWRAMHPYINYPMRET